MPSPSMTRMMCRTVDVKRRPTVSDDGKQAAPTVVIEDLAITPIDPLDVDEFHNIVDRYGIKNPVKLRGCYTMITTEIRTGDIFVDGDKEYTVKGLGPWWGDPETFYEIVLQEHVNE